MNSQPSVDDTLTAEASGVAVVDKVLSKMFDSGFLQYSNGILRRIACVESAYGTDTDTYRAGYHGGIWQVRTCIS